MTSSGLRVAMDGQVTCSRVVWAGRGGSDQVNGVRWALMGNWGGVGLNR